MNKLKCDLYIHQSEIEGDLVCRMVYRSKMYAERFSTLDSRERLNLYKIIDGIRHLMNKLLSDMNSDLCCYEGVLMNINNGAQWNLDKGLPEVINETVYESMDYFLLNKICPHHFYDIKNEIEEVLID